MNEMSYLPTWLQSPAGCPERRNSEAKIDVKSHRSRNEIHLPSIDLNSSIHGDGRNDRPQTYVVKRPKVVMNGQVWDSISGRHADVYKSPFKPCQFCGREFGSASIAIHERQCLNKNKQLSKKRASPKKSVQRTQRKSPELKLAEVSPSKIRGEWPESSWEPFGQQCPHCREKFGKHSIQLHEKRCRQKQDSLKTSQPAINRPMMSFERQASIVSNKSLDVGLIPAEYTATSRHSPRPETRTLKRSTLSGYILPCIDSTSTDIEMTTCANCGEEIPSDRSSVHKRTCRRQDPPKLTTGNVMFPSLPRVLKVDKDCTGDSEKTPRNSKSLIKPPTVVCYICRREYGTKSISIHEPQCFRKWQTENMRLPISQRKPLPKRPKRETAISNDDKRQIERMQSGSYGVIEMYFAECYKEFEKELLPCSKCGRTFAPERHVKHIVNCNAKPLVRSLLQ